MGNSYNIRCKNCGYYKEFPIGIGMMYYPERITDINSKDCLLPSLVRSTKAVSLIKYLLVEKKAVLVDGYGHWIYRCTKCGSLFGRFHLHLDYEGGSYEVQYKCPVCRTELTPLAAKPDGTFHCNEMEINLEEYPCPKCGNHELAEDTSNLILWD